MDLLELFINVQISFKLIKVALADTLLYKISNKNGEIDLLFSEFHVLLQERQKLSKVLIGAEIQDWKWLKFWLCIHGLQ